VGSPKLACCNLFPEVKHLREFALDHEFDGVDWTLKPEDLPSNRSQAQNFIRTISVLKPLEVRYHLFFRNVDLGHRNPAKSENAMRTFHRACRLVSELGGRVMTVHIGLGLESFEEISWEKTVAGLTSLANLARHSGIRVCLENLVSGWSSNPELYEQLLGSTNCRGTLDIGHALVCHAVRSKTHEIQDFALPHPERILNAHIYHEETSEGHLPPSQFTDLDQRLRLLNGLPLCDWWVLELREEAALLQTLGFVREFLEAHTALAAM
jgi:sugar phosphate isomerase/epimerase